jgi:cardiolipin synthase
MLSATNQNFSDIAQLISIGLVAIMAGHILLKKQDPAVCLGWLLALAWFPLIAAIFYLAVGINPFEKYAARKRASKHLASLRRKRKSNQEIKEGNREKSLAMNYLGFDRTATWVSMLSGQTLLSGNKVEVLVNSNSAFSAVNEAISHAKDYIFVQFYQIQIDSMGLGFLNLLAEKASQGVRVYVLFDALGSYKLKISHLEEYRRKGLKIHRFLEVHPIKRRFQINWRNHRKLIICDGEVAFAGGFNVGEMYLEGPNPAKPKWFDFIFRIQGSAIANLTDIFAEDWHFTTGKPIPADLLDKKNPEFFEPYQSENLLQVIASGPSESNALFQSALLSIIYEARERIWIMTPYFVPDKQLLHAMRLAVARGVDVQVIVPKHSNHPITDVCAHSYFPDLYQYGVKLLRYPHGMCHAKLVLADEDVVLVGSSNLDYRSFFLNFETDLFMRDKVLSKKMAEIYSSLAKQCIGLAHADVSNARLARLLFRRIMRLSAPLM